MSHDEAMGSEAGSVEKELDLGRIADALNIGGRPVEEFCFAHNPLAAPAPAEEGQ